MTGEGNSPGEIISYKIYGSLIERIFRVSVFVFKKLWLGV